MYVYCGCVVLAACVLFCLWFVCLRLCVAFVYCGCVLLVVYCVLCLPLGGSLALAVEAQ